MNFLFRTLLALLAALAVCAPGARGACGIRTQGAPEPDLYAGYFPRGFCNIRFFTNAPPETDLAAALEE